MFNWFLELNHIVQALMAGLFTFSITAFGASFVFLFKKINKSKDLDDVRFVKAYNGKLKETPLGGILVTVNNGVNIAIILQYGHGTKNGGYVEGIDYINPAIRPIFNKIAEDAWKEVTRT